MNTSIKTQVIVLGVGNFSNPISTNTSFLCNMGVNMDEYLLIDCGYDIYKELLINHKEKIKYIDNVFITHFHSDHIGSLGDLIYYRYFNYGLITKIFTLQNQMKKLETLLNIMVSNVLDKSSTSFKKLDFPCYKIIDYLIGCEPVQVDHFDGASGLYLYNKKIFFTGDTDILNYRSSIFEICDVIFHDCSLIEVPPGVHAYIKDIENKYPKEIKDSSWAREWNGS